MSGLGVPLDFYYHIFSGFMIRSILFHVLQHDPDESLVLQIERIKKFTKSMQRRPCSALVVKTDVIVWEELKKIFFFARMFSSGLTQKKEIRWMQKIEIFLGATQRLW